MAGDTGPPQSILKVRHPRYEWKISYKETQPDGSPVRRFRYFLNREEAKAFAEEREKELTNHGTRHGTVEDDERAALIKYRVWAEKRPDAPPLSALIERAIAAHETARPPHAVAQAIDARLDAVDRRKLSARHQADLKCRLERFASDFGTRQIRFICANVQVIDEFLQRATSIQAKSNLLQIIKASVPFSDIVG